MIDVYNFVDMFFKIISEFFSGVVSCIPIFMYKWQDLLGAMAGASLGAVASFVVARYTLDKQRRIDRENLKKQFRPVVRLQKKGVKIGENLDVFSKCCPFEIMNISDNLMLDTMIKVEFDYKGSSDYIEFNNVIPRIDENCVETIYLWNSSISSNETKLVELWNKYRSSLDLYNSKILDELHESFKSFKRDKVFNLGALESLKMLHEYPSSDDSFDFWFKLKLCCFFELVKINRVIVTFSTSQYEDLSYFFEINMSMYDLFCKPGSDLYFRENKKEVL